MGPENPAAQNSLNPMRYAAQGPRNQPKPISQNHMICARRSSVPPKSFGVQGLRLSAVTVEGLGFRGMSRPPPFRVPWLESTYAKIGCG